jgi:rhodanese-related sulfurtransferase
VRSRLSAPRDRVAYLRLGDQRRVELPLAGKRPAGEQQQRGWQWGAQRRERELPTDRPSVCICRSGNRSTAAYDLLARQGFTQLRNVQGGLIAWAQAGYPIQRR